MVIVSSYNLWHSLFSQPIDFFTQVVNNLERQNNFKRADWRLPRRCSSKNTRREPSWVGELVTVKMLPPINLVRLLPSLVERCLNHWGLSRWTKQEPFRRSVEWSALPWAFCMNGKSWSNPNAFYRISTFSLKPRAKNIYGRCCWATKKGCSMTAEVN